MGKKIIIGIVVAAVAALAGLHFYLQHGLTRTLQTRVLPAARARLGVKLSMDKAGVNLLRGSVLVRGVEVGNPAGFDEPRLAALSECRLDVGLLALLKGAATEVQDVRVEGATLTVVRNKAGENNLRTVLAAVQQSGKGRGKDDRRKEEQGAEAPALPRLAIRQLSTTMRLEYVDHRLPERPFRLGLNVHTLRLRDIATFGDTNAMTGRVTVQADFSADRASGSVMLRGKVAPIVDLNRPTFEVSGSIEAVDVRQFEPFTTEAGIEDGRVSGDVVLVCRDGVFDAGQSVLNLNFTNIKLSESLRARLGTFAVPEKLVVPAPVSGLLTNPQVDFKAALVKALTSPENLEAILKATLAAQGTNSPAAGVVQNVGGVSNVQSLISRFLSGGEEAKKPAPAEPGSSEQKKLKIPGELLRLGE